MAERYDAPGAGNVLRIALDDEVQTSPGPTGSKTASLDMSHVGLSHTIALRNGSTPLTTVSINDVKTNEGDSGTTAFTFTVTKTGPGAATVDFATANGSAVQPGDYQAASGTLSFAATDTTKTITVEVNGDVTYENDESFVVNLSNAAGAIISKSQGVGTIQNDDAPPVLTIDDAAVVEGSGTTAITFTVTITGATALIATVDFATADGSAIQPGDYTATSGRLSLYATPQTITVPVNGGTTAEDPETFFVNLSNATNATIGDGQGQGTIQNDDGTVKSYVGYGTLLSIPTPSSHTFTDVMLAGLAVHGGSGITITPPSGWTLIRRTDNGAELTLASYYHVVSDVTSEPANYSWSLSHTAYWSGGIISYAGIDRTSPIDVSSGYTETTPSYSVVASSVTTSFNNDLVVGIFAHDFHADGVSPPEGMTERYEIGNGFFGPTIEAAEYTKDQAGATGDKTARVHGSENAGTDHAAQLIALKLADEGTIELKKVWVGSPGNVTLKISSPHAPIPLRV
jgi:hypothetical protein